MKLTNIKIKNAKTENKPYKMYETGGLYLLIHPNGSKYWRLKYRLKNKENIYSIGVYPEISLSEAIEIKHSIKKLIKSGEDPNQNKKTAKKLEVTKITDTFGFVALEWHSKNSPKWTNKHSKKLKGWIDRDIIPIIGNIKISEVKSQNIVEVVTKIESRGAKEIARRVLSVCSQVLRYAMPLGKCSYDVTVGICKILEGYKKEGYKFIPVQEFPELMQKINNHNCNILTKLALKLIAHTFVRPTELRKAKWTEVDLSKAEWRIEPDRMKAGNLHIVPLSKQAIEILNEIKKLGFESDYVFPNINNTKKTISENTMLYALYDMGYHNKMTVHGFRKLASTILNENSFNRDAIELQLAHKESNKVRAAYNHAQYLPERREMMDWWGNYIEGLK